MYHQWINANTSARYGKRTATAQPAGSWRMTAQNAARIATAMRQAHGLSAPISAELGFGFAANADLNRDNGMHKCCNCSGTGEVGESPDGANWYSAACPVCDGAGETLRFVRAPNCDKKVVNGDDFAGWAWLDQETRKIVYGAVGHDRNTQ